jgi:hypothetical protein
MVIPRFGQDRTLRLATNVATVTMLVAMLLAFAVAGTVFLGLTIASPVAVPVAERRGIALSAADLTTAQHLASLWWLFAVGAVVSFGAALATIGTLIRRLGAPPER